MRVETTITIDRPVDDVLDFITKVENFTRWSENAVEAVQTSDGPVGEGTTCRIVNRAMGREVAHDFVVTEYRQGERYSARSTSGPFEMTIEYIVEEVDTGTRLYSVATAEFSGLMALAEPMLRARAQQQIKADHQTLKRLLESGEE